MATSKRTNVGYTKNQELILERAIADYNSPNEVPKEVFKQLRKEFGKTQGAIYSKVRAMMNHRVNTKENVTFNDELMTVQQEKGEDGYILQGNRLFFPKIKSVGMQEGRLFIEF